MKNNDKNKKENADTRTNVVIMVVALALVPIVMTIVWQIPQATAAPLEETRATREIPSPVDEVWYVVSDIDNETKYWSTFKAIKNINTAPINETSNTTEREVTIEAGPFGDTLTHQFVTVNSEQYVVKTDITEGPVIGIRTLALTPSSSTNATRIEVLWNVDLSGIPIFGRGFAKDGIMRTTEEAITSIAAELEVR